MLPQIFRLAPSRLGLFAYQMKSMGDIGVLGLRGSLQFSGQGCGPIKSFQTAAILGSNKKLWSLGKINHIALVTPDLDKSAKLYHDVLGGNVSGKQALPEHGVTTVFVELGDTKIELLHPLGEKSPIQSFLDKNKAGGMHHICLEVDDIKKAMVDLKSHNIRLLSEEPRTGAHGKPVIFLHPKDCDGVLVELEEA